MYEKTNEAYIALTGEAELHRALLEPMEVPAYGSRSARRIIAVIAGDITRPMPALLDELYPKKLNRGADIVLVSHGGATLPRIR